MAKQSVKDPLSDLSAVVASIRQKREALAIDLARLDRALEAFGELSGGSRNGSRRSVGKPGRKAKRGKRGAGWAVVEKALKSQGGKGSTTDLKASWAKLGSSTPLSVALSSYVKSKRLKKHGSGRTASYSLA